MKKFYVGIKGVIVRDDKVLLLHAQRADRDFWEVPGGRIDADETIEQTLRRELSEEVPNIHSIQVHEVLDAFRVPIDIDGDIGLTLIFFRISADFDGDPQISHEHAAWKWVTKDEALQLADDSCKTAITRAL